MYAEHVPKISAGMKACPEVFRRGVLFSCLSARQPITSVPGMLQDIDKNGGQAEAVALPNKYACWEFLESHATRTWKETLGRDVGDALRYLARGVPGLGIIKAAFVLQFLGHDIACLDTHNKRKWKIPMRAFDHRGTSQGYHEPQFKRYLEHALGKAAFAWDDWCIDRARWYETTPEEISALHLEVIA